ncbi:hypothetical protein ZWY2020_051925 [Hordeum vulgare]|nr:hypothetical protein ZWY2020_051925 [Hordeum vulgare]
MTSLAAASLYTPGTALPPAGFSSGSLGKFTTQTTIAVSNIQGSKVFFLLFSVAAVNPLVAQAVPDRPLFSDSAILSPYATAPDDIMRGFASAAELPDPLRRAGVDPPLMPVSADLATEALVGVVIDDAAQHALMDAEMPITFPTDTTGVEKFVARFIDNLNK